MRKPKLKRWICFVLGWALLINFMLGSTITISYNKDKARKARKTFWSKVVKIAKEIGIVKGVF